MDREKRRGTSLFPHLRPPDVAGGRGGGGASVGARAPPPSPLRSPRRPWSLPATAGGRGNGNGGNAGVASNRSPGGRWNSRTSAAGLSPRNQPMRGLGGVGGDAPHGDGGWGGREQKEWQKSTSIAPDSRGQKGDGENQPEDASNSHEKLSGVNESGERAGSVVVMQNDRSREFSVPRTGAAEALRERSLGAGGGDHGDREGWRILSGRGQGSWQREGRPTSLPVAGSVGREDMRKSRWVPWEGHLAGEEEGMSGASKPPQTATLPSEPVDAAENTVPTPTSPFEANNAQHASPQPSSPAATLSPKTAAGEGQRSLQDETGAKSWVGSDEFHEEGPAAEGYSAAAMELIKSLENGMPALDTRVVRENLVGETGTSARGTERMMTSMNHDDSTNCSLDNVEQNYTERSKYVAARERGSPEGGALLARMDLTKDPWGDEWKTMQDDWDEGNSNMETIAHCNDSCLVEQAGRPVKSEGRCSEDAVADIRIDGSCGRGQDLSASSATNIVDQTLIADFALDHGQTGAGVADKGEGRGHQGWRGDAVRREATWERNSASTEIEDGKLRSSETVDWQNPPIFVAEDMVTHVPEEADLIVRKEPPSTEIEADMRARHVGWRDHDRSPPHPLVTHAGVVGQGSGGWGDSENDTARHNSGHSGRLPAGKGRSPMGRDEEFMVGQHHQAMLEGQYELWQQDLLLHPKHSSLSPPPTSTVVNRRVTNPEWWHARDDDGTSGNDEGKKLRDFDQRLADLKGVMAELSSDEGMPVFHQAYLLGYVVDLFGHAFTFHRPRVGVLQDVAVHGQLLGHLEALVGTTSRADVHETCLRALKWVTLRNANACKVVLERHAGLLDFIENTILAKAVSGRMSLLRPRPHTVSSLAPPFSPRRSAAASIEQRDNHYHRHDNDGPTAYENIGSSLMEDVSDVAARMDAAMSTIVTLVRASHADSEAQAALQDRFLKHVHNLLLYEDPFAGQAAIAAAAAAAAASPRYFSSTHVGMLVGGSNGGGRPGRNVAATVAAAISRPHDDLELHCVNFLLLLSCNEANRHGLSAVMRYVVESLAGYALGVSSVRPHDRSSGLKLHDGSHGRVDGAASRHGSLPSGLVRTGPCHSMWILPAANVFADNPAMLDVVGRLLEADPHLAVWHRECLAAAIAGKEFPPGSRRFYSPYVLLIALANVVRSARAAAALKVAGLQRVLLPQPNGGGHSGKGLDDRQKDASGGGPADLAELAYYLCAVHESMESSRALGLVFGADPTRMSCRRSEGMRRGASAPDAFVDVLEALVTWDAHLVRQIFRRPGDDAVLNAVRRRAEVGRKDWLEPVQTGADMGAVLIAMLGELARPLLGDAYGPLIHLDPEPDAEREIRTIRHLVRSGGRMPPACRSMLARTVRYLAHVAQHDAVNGMDVDALAIACGGPMLLRIEDRLNFLPNATRLLRLLILDRSALFHDVDRLPFEPVC